MKNSQKEIQVFAHWKGLEKPTLMGILSAAYTRGKEIFSFAYSKNWISSDSGQYLDPELKLYEGPQYLSQEKINFGIFLDSSPDRWGRMLMRRREAVLARKEGRKANNLSEMDYLLGVYDEHRMGAIRFKEENGPFLNNDSSMASPPWTSLKDLEYACSQIEKDDIVDDPEYINWLRMLMAPGSSLGGARPKAGVLDNKNNLWIAKFPSKNDDKDIGAWEMVVHELAKISGVAVAEAKIEKFNSRYYTFLTKRFDRTNIGERIHFASAMTLLGHKDRDDFNEGVSYLEFVEFLMKYSARTNHDLGELWRRIVFSICVSNTDDHLRNHGFLLSNDGWILSPAYDINANETGTGLKLNISENDNSLDLDLAMDVAKNFRIDLKDAAQIKLDVIKSVSNWRIFAKKFGISKNEQEMMDKAFYK
jgi:serine/threonine-protein kinase HipA